MPSQSFLSPLPLDDDLRTLDATERVRPGSSGMGGDVVSAWGGPVGAHAAVGRQRFFTPLRVVLAFAVLFLCFGFFSKAACLETSHPTNGQQAGLMWDGRQYYKACYNDLVPLYGAEGLSKGALPYKYMWVEGDGTTRYMEYPVVSGMFQYVNAQLAKGWEALSPGSPLEVSKYVMVSCLFLALGWMVAVWATYRSTGRRPWDTLFMACSPLVVFQAFTNFDTIAVALGAVGLLMWARRKPALAGVFLGLGIAAKLYPLFLFGALLTLAVRRRRFRELAVTAGAAAGVWVLVNLPIMIPFPQGWREFFRLNTDRPANPESIYSVLQDLTGSDWFNSSASGDVATLNTVSLVLFVLCCAGVFALGLLAPRTPRLAQLAFLIVAAFLVTNKVWSPQYSLWLVPLAVLAIPSVRVLLPWMAFDAMLWVAHMSYFNGVDKKGLDPLWFHSLVLVRDLLVLAVCVAVVRQILRPWTDAVRRDHAGSPLGQDPLAGPFADPDETLDAAPEVTDRGGADRGGRFALPGRFGRSGEGAGEGVGAGSGAGSSVVSPA